MGAMIELQQTGRSEPLAFEFAVSDGRGTSRHRVTLSRTDRARLASAEVPPERCVEAAFRFLLEREPKEAILARFDVSVISRPFPDFEDAVPGTLAGGGSR